MSLIKRFLQSSRPARQAAELLDVSLIQLPAPTTRNGTCRPAFCAR